MAINLVEYHNSDLSTIYILTNSDYKIHKLDIENNDPRHTYTLEKIEKGPAVYQLLMKRWNLAKGLRLKNT